MDGASSRAPSGWQLQGRYRVESRVCVGGMGELWRGVDRETGGPVAVKRVLPHLQIEAEGVAPRRMLREGEALARLSHPNLVQLLHSDVDGEGRPYLVLEWLEGEDLAARLVREELPLSAALELIERLLDALEACHAAGVVHRDVKPANIFLVEGDDPPGIKLLDLGVAALVDRLTRLTRTGMAVGTLHFMAPEQLSESSVLDRRTDVYAAGVVLYRLVTGQLPFPSNEPLALMLQIMSETPPLPSLVRPGAPPWLDDVVLRAMMRAPGDRFPSAAQMREALAEHRAAASAGRGLAPSVAAGEPQTGQRALLHVDLLHDDPDGDEAQKARREVERAISGAGGRCLTLLGGRTVGLFEVGEIAEVAEVAEVERRATAPMHALEAARAIRDRLGGRVRILASVNRLTGGRFDTEALERGARAVARVPSGGLAVDESLRELADDARMELRPLGRRLSLVSGPAASAGEGEGEGETPDLSGQVLNGTYRVERRIAAGGMGVIYEATHARLPGQRFAVKLLRRISPEVLRRFRQEAEIASRLGHPNIVYVVDFNETEAGWPYLVMEHLEGEDLASRLHQRGRLALAELLPIVAQVGSALAAAHEGGVVHRDIKPENIFLCSDGSGGERVKVLDFGISKVRASASAMTTDHVLLGTTYYMSPEQAEGLADRVDSRTDIFALGTICYEALTGLLPFNAASVPSILYRICHVRPPPAVTLNPELPPAVDGVLARAMAKRREDRYPEVGQLVADLERCLRPEAVTLVDVPVAAATPVAAASAAASMPASMPAPPRRAPSRWWLIGAAVVGVLLAGGGTYLATRSDSGMEGPAALDMGARDGASAAAIDAGLDAPPRTDAARATPRTKPRPRRKPRRKPKPKKGKNGQFLFDKL